jgi:hypothetical protein
LQERIFDWLRARRTRYTRSDAEIEAAFGGARKRGILIGVWSGWASDAPPLAAGAMLASTRVREARNRGSRVDAVN